MASLHENFLAGTITDSPLSNVATTINSAAFANLPTVAAPNYMWLVLDPTQVAGAPEIVQVTAHTAAATSITVTRGAQSSSARSHLVSTIWRATYTKTDADAHLLAKSGVATGDLLYASSATATARLPIGTATQVLHGGATPSYSQIVAGDIASDAVTTVKILDANVTTAKIADGDVTDAKLEQHVEIVELDDDEAAYLTFGTADSRGIIVIAGNTSSAGNAVVAFRVGSANAYCTVVASAGPTVTAGTGTLAGTTGTDTHLTIRANTANNRLYIENRTGAARSYGFSLLGMQVGAPSTPAWTAV